MTLEDLACKLACQDMLVRFCEALDGGGGAADYFTDDASMLTPTGETVQGADVKALVASRPTATIATRHIMSNVLVEPAGADRAKATATILVYRTPRQDPDVLPRPLPSTPQAVGEWSLELERRSGGWKIGRYAAVSVLEPAKA